MAGMDTVVSAEHLAAWRRLAEFEARANSAAADRARAELPGLVAILRRQYGAGRIVLFGSLARGRFRADSDIDLAAEGIPPDRFFDAYGELIATSSFPVDLKPLEALEPRFLARVLATGEEL